MNEMQNFSVWRAASFFPKRVQERFVQNIAFTNKTSLIQRWFRDVKCS